MGDESTGVTGQIEFQARRSTPRLIILPLALGLGEGSRAESVNTTSQDLSGTLEDRHHGGAGTTCLNLLWHLEVSSLKDRQQLVYGKKNSSIDNVHFPQIKKLKNYLTDRVADRRQRFPQQIMQQQLDIKKKY